MKALSYKIAWIWRHGGNRNTYTCLHDCRGGRSYLKKPPAADGWGEGEW